ncbi:GTP-binding protein HflX [Anaerohalosphaera lusitana]|uniref:GTPase HflX n=1 Tax=Anaerohalosphaera lusitana TaxID=1936003 RepID=A0A1U9NP54_9BACT|nr:GTPase HflX [Anaerohalosphaera lusitana]AQT69577.1 GTP-binding protein HflX [Anaerohalosphaera lusitana]
METLKDKFKVQKERAILVAAAQRGESGYKYNDLSELSALAESAGAAIVYKLQQKIDRINPSTYIGRGKAELLGEHAESEKADVVIFDNDLSPAQIRELEKVVGVRVIDRSELILDIFATRARTRQAKLQVELAQLQYTYPRLTRLWSHLDTVAGAAGGAGAAGAVGGIGTRGTGEKQLEIDRRLVNKRITELKREIEGIDKRKMREIKGRHDQYKVSLVGYTNAGKSTLMNALTDAEVFVEDRLFATLDTRTRKWSVDKGVEVLLSDTVGFVSHLPHHLVASFKATLEEAVHADLLLQVVDVSDEDVFEQIKSVDQVLDDIGCGEKERLVLFNKSDALASEANLESLQAIYPDAICISARTGMNLDLLAQAVLDRYRQEEMTVRVKIALSDGKTQSFLRGYCEILEENYTDSHVEIEARLGKSQLPALKSLKPAELRLDA